MAVVSRQDIEQIALLARLKLEDQEVATFSVQLDEILKYVQQLQAVSTDTIEPTSHVLPLSNITRPDERRPCLGPEASLKLAPARHGQLIKVPKVIE
jgi:aspartyl-tRNA(Asn)/glutamyl-tRNA(Gln) amidotransferase subunit C